MSSTKHKMLRAQMPTLCEMLDVGIELVPSLDVEYIRRFPVIHRKGAMTGRGPPSLHRFM
jgi:hypothetical protein